MKNHIHILIYIVIIGCASRAEKSEQDDSRTAEIIQLKYVELNKKMIGFWVNEEYYKSLVETRSTKKAGNLGVDDFYRISEDNSIMRMNVHEGGANNIILMTSEYEGQIFNSDTSESYSKIEFQHNTLLIEDMKYIKAPDGENGLNELVNSAFITGKYWWNESEIEFKTNGTIIGLDSARAYKLNLDYNDAGMQFDKIFIQFNNEKQMRTYLCNFNLDTLIISKIDCKIQAEDYDYCLEVEKGETIYTLIKK